MASSSTWLGTVWVELGGLVVPRAVGRQAVAVNCCPVPEHPPFRHAAAVVYKASAPPLTRGSLDHVERSKLGRRQASSSVACSFAPVKAIWPSAGRAAKGLASNRTAHQQSTPFFAHTDRLARRMAT